MRIIYQNSEGGCSVVVPAPDSGLTIEEVIAKCVPAGTPHKVVPVNEVPSDRTYRNAWAADVVNGKVTHDMVKAREIHKGHMRTARTPLLAALDVAYIKADEKGPSGAAEKAQIAAEKAQIAAQKAVLRDCTKLPAIDAAATIDDLRAVWIPELGPNPNL